MRKLICIPIIHAEADLGSLGPALSRRSASLVGDNRWAQHNKVVAKFWQSVSNYLESLDASRLKIYQDGLAIDGELARRVVEKAAARGSMNHRILLDLIKRGAEIRKAEDVSLLLEGHRDLVKGTQWSGVGEIELGRVALEEQRRLDAARDRYIADRVNETLKEGEIGLLLLGANHEAVPLLEKDIAVEWVKEAEAVKAYFLELVLGQDEKRYHRLSSYLVSPIVINH